MGESYLYLNTDNDAVDFDIQVGANGGLALTEPAFHHAKRLYEDTTLTAAEDYTKRGGNIAKSLHFGSANEYLAAWMNETRKQADLIYDIDMVLSLNILKKLPQWMRHDLFLTLEAEAMKQVFASRFVQSKDEQIHLPATLRQSINDNATNKIHATISSLMETMLKTPLSYNKAGQEFYAQYEILMAEFQSI